MASPLELHCGAEVVEVTRDLKPTRIGDYVVILSAVGISIFHEENAQSLAMELLRAPRTTTKKRVRRVKE